MTTSPPSELCLRDPHWLRGINNGRAMVREWVAAELASDGHIREADHELQIAAEIRRGTR